MFSMLSDTVVDNSSLGDGYIMTVIDEYGIDKLNLSLSNIRHEDVSMDCLDWTVCKYKKIYLHMGLIVSPAAC